MVTRVVPRVRAFYAKYLPVGDRLGEMFYAVWMAVISLGVLGSTELDAGAIVYAILLAFGVNMTWGLIDGISVMHTNIIDRARTEQLIYDLRSRNDQPSREAALSSLDDSVTSGLDDAGREKVLDLVAAGAAGADPKKKKYYPGREDWYYALGIFAIDTVLVIPIAAPLFIWSEPADAIYASRLVATVLFAILGAAYARNLHRRRWLAALFLGTLCFNIFSLAFLAGW
jgi:hypothetical protein